MDADRDPEDVVRPLVRTRQVRQFTERPVDAAALDALVDVARWSGSSKNAQPWRFVVVTRTEVTRRLGELDLPMTRALQTATAAIAITVPDREGWRIGHAYDEGRAAERILIAASMLGLGAGIVWMQGDARAPARELLGVPDGWIVRTVVALGHPTDAAKRPKSERGEARLPRSETVRRERWDDR